MGAVLGRDLCQQRISDIDGGDSLTNIRCNLALRSTLRPNGDVELSIDEIDMPQPRDDEVVVEMLAAPLHPADQSLLFARADPNTAERLARGGRDITVLRATGPLAKAQRSRWDVPMPLGMEGAGRVVLAGRSKEANNLLGRYVAAWGGGMYARYRAVPLANVIALHDDVSPAEGAAAFVNPLTALGMIETLRDEGFTALVHTAAASTLGQILCRLCQRDGIALVNVVRSKEQVGILRSLGAEHICNSSDAGFDDDLCEAIRATGATLGFDATGGGTLASRILAAMEQVCMEGRGYQHYGSSTRKRIYIYGTLDSTPLQLLRNYGLAWDVGGWLLFHFLERIEAQRLAALKERIAAELKTTFTLRYRHAIALERVCDPEILRDAARRATGEKYLISVGP